MGCDHDSPKNLPEFSKGPSEITTSRGFVPRSLLLLMAGLLGITLQFRSFQDSQGDHFTDEETQVQGGYITSLLVDSLLCKRQKPKSNQLQQEREKKQLAGGSELSGNRYSFSVSGAAVSRRSFKVIEYLFSLSLHSAVLCWLYSPKELPQAQTKQLWVHFYLLSHARGKRAPSRISNKRLKADFSISEPIPVARVI